MEKSNRHSAGGIATAIKFRSEAISKYYENPSMCKNCNNVIEVRDKEKVSSVKKKKFCNSSCSAEYNNRRREKKIKPEKQIKNNLDFIGLMTKDEVFKRYGTYQSARSTICKHARRTFNIPVNQRKCLVCGYDKHTDISHIIPVSSFSPETKISEINHIDNLAPLCPNHHWEFDNKLIDIKNYKNRSNWA